MLKSRIIPCLDVRDGRVVKGVQFQGLRDAGDPAELAANYEQQGADEIALLDVSATTEGRRAARETIGRVRRQIALPLTVGGGVTGIDAACELLESGADKVSVNSAAVSDPTIVDAIASTFGSQCCVVAIDAASDGAGGWEVVTHSGRTRTGKDAVAWAEEVVSRGSGEILLTSWDRDGTKSGYDLALLDAISSRVRVPIIASGGAAHAQHMFQAFEHGATAALAASIFHFGTYTVKDIKVELSSLGIKVRL